MQLSHDQEQAKNMVVDWFYSKDSKYTPCIVTGAAGTGKTTTVKEIIKALHIDPTKQLVLAQTASATTNIMIKSAEGVSAKTIASTLKQPTVYITLHDLRDRPLKTYSDVSMGDISSLEDFYKDMEEIGYKATKRAENAELVNIGSANQSLKKHGHYLVKSVSFDTLREPDLSEFAIAVIDELGMVTHEELNMIVKSGIPVLAVGDPHQLEPVGSQPTPLIYDKSKKYYTELTTIHRQEGGNPILDVADACREGLGWLQTAYNVHGDIVGYYRGQKLTPAQLASADKILTMTNKKVVSYNKDVHEYYFGANNLLGVGEKLVITQNTKSTRGSLPILANGQDVIIKSVKPAIEDVHAKGYEHGLLLVDLEANGEVFEDVLLNTVDMTNPKISAYAVENNREVDPLVMYRRKDKERMDGYIARNTSGEIKEIIYATYGYATTVHKAQGKEYNNVILDSAIPYPMLSQEAKLSYTAVTRAKERLIII